MRRCILFLDKIGQGSTGVGGTPAMEEAEEESGTQESEDVNGRNRKMVINSREDLNKFDPMY